MQSSCCSGACKFWYAVVTLETKVLDCVTWSYRGIGKLCNEKRHFLYHIWLHLKDVKHE
jgi:hypothetical protein